MSAKLKSEAAAGRPIMLNGMPICLSSSIRSSTRRTSMTRTPSTRLWRTSCWSSSTALISIGHSTRWYPRAWAAEAAQARGYHLVLWPMEINAVDELQQLVRQSLVDGVLVMEVRLVDERIELLKQIGVPFSMIGRPAAASDFSFADIDFEQTTRDAVAYLVELGHQQIAFLNHSEELFNAGYGPSVRAVAGFERAARAAGLTPISRFCGDTALAGQEVFEEIIRAHPEVTALATMNERATVGVMQAVATRGWRIPDDLSIVSCVSSARVAEMTLPPLTAMTPPSAELGRLGVEMLIAQLEGGRHELVQRLLPCRLVVRGSTGPSPDPAHRSRVTASSD